MSAAPRRRRVDAKPVARQRPRMATVYEFQPVGLDAMERRAHQPAPGTRVVKTQPAGCPRNGTMGHTFVADAETGAFYGLVLTNSLRRVRAAR